MSRRSAIPTSICLVVALVFLARPGLAQTPAPPESPSPGEPAGKVLRLVLPVVIIVLLAIAGGMVLLRRRRSAADQAKGPEVD
jgi:hypothetical protein